MKQLVYRCERKQPFDLVELKDAEFRFLACPLDVLPLWRPLYRCLGLPGLIKTVVKLITRRRRFYCILSEKEIAHYAWVSFSFCRYYPVALGDVVIGPIMTDVRHHGRGYATAALKLAINRLTAEGSGVFWIDTSEDNVPCQRVIEKCGFGTPVSSFERPPGGL